MLSLDDQLGRVLSGTGPLPPITVQLLDGLGCVLAADATARVAQGTDAVFLPSGTRVATRHLPTLVAAGVTTIDVVPHPRVVLLATGSGRTAGADHILLSAACDEAGAQVYRVAAPEDRPLNATIEDQLVRADVVLATADDVHSLAGQLTMLGDVQVHDVAVSPRMAVAYGLIGEEQAPVIVLPSSPMPAYLGFEVLVRPLLRTLAGDDVPFRATVRARVTTAWQPPPGVQELRLGCLEVSGGMYAFRPTADGDPAAMLACSNAFASVPPGPGALSEGTSVLVVPLEGTML